MKLKNNSGFSLIAALVGIGLVSVISLTLLNNFKMVNDFNSQLQRKMEIIDFNSFVEMTLSSQKSCENVFGQLNLNISPEFIGVRPGQKQAQKQNVTLKDLKIDYAKQLHTFSNRNLTVEDVELRLLEQVNGGLFFIGSFKFIISSNNTFINSSPLPIYIQTNERGQIESCSTQVIQPVCRRVKKNKVYQNNAPPEYYKVGDTINYEILNQNVMNSGAQARVTAKATLVKGNSKFCQWKIEYEAVGPGGKNCKREHPNYSLVTGYEGRIGCGLTHSDYHLRGALYIPDVGRAPVLNVSATDRNNTQHWCSHQDEFGQLNLNILSTAEQVNTSCKYQESYIVGQ